MTLDEIETLEDAGIYFSEWMRNNCDVHNTESRKRAENFLDDLCDCFSLSDLERGYIRSRVFLKDAQSNDATLKLAQLADRIRIKGRR